MRELDQVELLGDISGMKKKTLIVVLPTALGQTFGPEHNNLLSTACCSQRSQGHSHLCCKTSHFSPLIEVVFL